MQLNKHLNHNFLSQSEKTYFKDLFNELKDTSTNAISFDNFRDIVNSSKRTNRLSLNDQLNSIKKVIELKKEFLGKAIVFSKSINYS